MIVDAHHHFWQIERGLYDWIDDSIWELRRDYLPPHLAPYLRQLGINKTILVQAAEDVTDNPFLLDMAAQSGFVGGIVAWVDLTAKKCPKQLEQLSDAPLVKGIRPVLQGIADNDWVLQADILANLRRLPALDLRFDALVQPRHLDTIAQLTDAIPDLPIVIDHAAKPVIAGGAALSDDWRAGMAALAQCPNVHCKLSGLATEYGQGWTVDALRPVSDHLLAHFGADRLMWGSDWPVLERHGSYVQWFSAARKLVPTADHAAVFGNTAARFYGLT